MRSVLATKKGLMLGDLYGSILTIVLIGVVLGAGLYVLDKFEDNMTGNAATAVNTTIAGLDDFASWIAIIVVVIAAAVVLGTVLSSFGQQQQV